MTNKFSVEVLDFQVLAELLESRPVGDIDKLLEEMEYGDTSDISEDEKFEVLSMLMQEIPPNEAAVFVLQLDLADSLSKGQIDNLSHQMVEERMWEEYSDLSLHERLFNVGSFLYKMVPRVFPKPNAVKITLKIAAMNDHAKDILEHPLNEAFLVRLVADGMGERGLLHRMYDDQLASHHFDDATKIIWLVEPQDEGGDSVRQVGLISSGCWFDPLKDVVAYESTAFNDS